MFDPNDATSNMTVWYIKAIACLRGKTIRLAKKTLSLSPFLDEILRESLNLLRLRDYGVRTARSLEEACRCRCRGAARRAAAAVRHAAAAVRWCCGQFVSSHTKFLRVQTVG